MKIEKQDKQWRDAQHLSREHWAHERKHKSEGCVDVEGWISCHKNTFSRRDPSIKEITVLSVKKVQQTCSVADLNGTPGRRLLKDKYFRFMDEAMKANLELTSRQLHGMVAEKFSDVNVSISTIKRARKALGWSAKKTRYCALINEVNKEKKNDVVPGSYN